MATPTPRRRRADDAPAWHGWWTRQRPLVRHGLVAALLVLLTLTFFSPVLFGGRSLIGGDTVQWRAMAESALEYEEATGEDALWVPNMFSGMPANMIHYPKRVPQLDNLVSALRPWVWPAMHFLALVLGVYALAFYLIRRGPPALIAACAFGLTTYLPLILTAGHNSKFITLAYVPWLLLAFAHALRRPTLLAALFVAITAAIELRAGHVQITYYAVWTMAIWWACEGIQSVRKGEGARFARATAVLVFGGLLGLLMVAQPYLSNWEYKAFTIRGASTGGGEGGLDLGYAMAWSQGVGELWTLLIADAYGGGQFYWGPKPFTAGPHYVGGTVILLAVLALYGMRRVAVAGLGCSALVMTLFALGEHLPVLNEAAFEYIPLFASFRVPETWLALVALALAILAAFGAAWATQTHSDRSQHTTRAVLTASGVLILVVAILWIGRGALFSFEREGEAQGIAQQLAQQIAQQRPDLDPSDPRVAAALRQQIQTEIERRQELRSEAFASDALRTLIFLLLSAGVLMLARRRTVPGWAACFLLALLVTVDLWGVDRRYFNEDRLTRADDIEDEIPTYGFDRYLMEQVDEAGGPGRFRVLSLEGQPMTNARPSYHYESIGGYHGAKLRLYQDFIDRLFRDERGLPDEEMLDLLNVRYVVAPAPLPGTLPVYTDEQTGYGVFENPDVLPRAFFPEQVEVVEDAQTRLDRLAAPSFQPRETALLAEPLPGSFEHTAGPAPDASTELLHYDNREIRLDVKTDAPRLLVLSEVYYPAGWHAMLDGEAVDIVQANHFLRGVPVPAGEHEVVLRYDPASDTWGFWISLVSTLLVYGGLVVLAIATRRRKAHDPAEDTP